MKRKEFKSKLTLNKKTITNLENHKIHNYDKINGGASASCWECPKQTGSCSNNAKCDAFISEWFCPTGG